MGKPDPSGTSIPVADDGRFARAVVETIRQPLLVLDDDLRVVSANQAFYRHFQLSPEETLGARLFALGGGHWDNPSLRELLGRVLPEHGTVEDFEVRHDLPRLGRRILLVNARQVELGDEQYRAILIAFDDVTDQRRAEDALQRYARRLERSNRDLEEFAHAASHDLQEPLRKVHAFTDRLARSFAPDVLDERQRGDLDRIRDAARRMQQRIDDLLALARVSRTEPERRPIELSTVVRQVLRDLDPAGAGIAVEVGPLPAIEADRAQMELLFQNLIGNAIKYRRPDVPSAIRVTSAPAPAADERAWVSISVADDGIGFDPVHAERIFRPFERLHGRDAYEGSGVGLAVCQRVAEAHGGTIRAEGRPGVGATFVVTLPITRTPEI